MNLRRLVFGLAALVALASSIAFSGIARSADSRGIAGRSYVQPSRKIDLSQFDITNPDGIRAAYELGVKDGNAFAASLGC